MNRYFLNTINKVLASGIDKGYSTGIKSIVQQNKTGVPAKFSKKNKLLSVNYTAKDKEAIRNFKINAFKVAGVGSYELQQELKQLGVDVLDNKIPDFDTFELAVRQKMLQYGIGLGNQPPTGWLKQNLDHAIKSSIQGARWIRVTDPEIEGVYVAWIYHTQLDDRVRDEHQALEGKVFLITDPAAASMIPPNDWGCRCYEEYITRAEAEGMNIIAPQESKHLLKEVPEDFRFNPGIAQDIWGRWLEQKLSGMPDNEVNKLESLLKDYERKL